MSQVEKVIKHCHDNKNKNMKRHGMSIIYRCNVLFLIEASFHKNPKVLDNILTRQLWTTGPVTRTLII